jgi:hypothetical protein
MRARFLPLVLLILYGGTVWAAFEPSPLEDPLFIGKTDPLRLRVGYEDLGGMVGYTYLKLIGETQGISLQTSSDHEGLYREFSIRYTRYILIKGMRLTISPSYLSCSAKGDFGRVGVGRGGSLDIGVGFDLGPLRVEAMSLGLIGGIRYTRNAFKEIGATSYWERPSRDLIVGLAYPVRCISGGVRLGIWNANPFLSFQLKPTRFSLLGMGWIWGKGARGGARFELKADFDDFSLRYRHLIGRLGMQSVAFDISLKVRG